MRLPRDFLRFYLVPVVLFAGVVLTAVFTAIYTVTARTQDGRILSSQWPRAFTLEFAQYLNVQNASFAVSPDGQALLRENDLWLQVLDADGREVYGQDKPAHAPDAYAPYALLEVYQYGNGQDSVFVGNVEAGDASYTYLIGFPLSISKVTMYVDNARYQSGKVLIVAVIALTGILVITLTIYSYKTFASAEENRKRDDAAKEEWLANITHDLKTPLSPIVGYAELLSMANAPISQQQAQRYGSIILKNAHYAESLVGDLRMTYQLKSGMLPLRKSKQQLTRFAREVVIDLLNTPDFAGRDVSFSPAPEDMEAVFDPLLMKRALTNILTNALIHNAQASVSVFVGRDNGSAVLTVEDQGGGMTQKELEHLFTRYYRGTNTQMSPEGSGLGMAIARQIVEAHGGFVQAQSRLSEGTKITIGLPVKI